MKVAKPLQNVIDSFQKLPGVGPKSAQRLAYYLLHIPQSELDSFGDALQRLKKDTVLCSNCKNVSETDPCSICSNQSRSRASIMILEQPLDILSFERTGKYKGLYHILHGSINPLDNIGPDEIYINDLIIRVKENYNEINEIIIATNPTMEGEATAMYITKKIKDEIPSNGHVIKITRLGVGVPTGASLEFADENTLIQAMEGRRNL